MCLLNKIMRVRKKPTAYTDKILKKTYRKGTSLHKQFKRIRNQSINSENMVLPIITYLNFKENV